MSQTLSYRALLKLLLPEDWRQSESYLAGLEREMLRVSANGTLPQSPHPVGWGSAMHNPEITLDFAETQPELVTPPFPSMNELLDYTGDLHRFTAQQLPSDQGLWFQSMPPQLEASQIQAANFGPSNAGKIKSIYRKGLANRYGKNMQVISGVHFNFSWSETFWQRLHERVGDSRKLPVFVSENYLALLRNHLRFSWLLAYLMGATPAIDRSFIKRQPEELSPWKEKTLIGPFATSLRMSRIGYVSSSRCTSSISYNSLTDYLSNLYQAITTECDGFSLIGLKNEQDEYRQLNSNILQIENEHYALARPKQPVQANERPFKALRERGVAYVEVRALDVQPDHALGVHPEQLNFIRLFLLYCLLKPNPLISKEEEQEMSNNHQQAALLGRKPGVSLRRNGTEISLQQWGHEILEEMKPLAETLDRYSETGGYAQLIEQQEKLLDHPELTPSARVLAELEAQDLEFLDWGQQLSQSYLEQLRQEEISEDNLKGFQQNVQASLQKQAELDQSPQMPFADYLKDFGVLKPPGLLPDQA